MECSSQWPARAPEFALPRLSDHEPATEHVKPQSGTVITPIYAYFKVARMTETGFVKFPVKCKLLLKNQPWNGGSADVLVTLPVVSSIFPTSVVL